MRRLILIFILAAIPGMAFALDDVDRLEMRAEVAFAERNYDLAIQCWSDAIKLSPGEASIYINRAASYAAKKETDKQLADYGDAIRLAPDDPAAYQLRAKFYVERMMEALRNATPYADGDADKAIADSEQLMRIQLAGVADPKAAALEAAKKSAKEWNYPMAAACWNTVVKLDPNDAAAWFRLAILNEMLLKPDKASTACNEVLRLDPKNADAATLRAQIDAGWVWENDSHPFNRQDKHAEAGEHEKAIADYNLSIWLGGERLWESYAQRGSVYANAGKWQNAVADYTEAIRIGSEGFVYGNYEGRADAYMQGGQYDKAAADYITAAVEWHKEEASEYSHDPEGRTKDSVESENFMAAQYLIRAAEAYARGGKYDRAIALLENDLKIEPKNDWCIAALAWLYATSPDAKLRNGATAVKLVKRAGGGDPYFADILAAAYAEAGQWEDAVKSEKEAIEGDKDDSQKAIERKADAIKEIASGAKWVPTKSNPASPQDRLKFAERYIKEDAEEIKEFTARLELYQQKKPCRDMKEFQFGG